MLPFIRACVPPPYLRQAEPYAALPDQLIVFACPGCASAAPSAGLDSEMSLAVAASLARLARRGATVLLSVHQASA